MQGVFISTQIVDDDDQIRCGQCKRRKPRSEFTKGDKILKSCLPCRQSKDKFTSARPRKTSRRVTQKSAAEIAASGSSGQASLQVAARVPQTYESTQPVYTQSVESYTSPRDWPDQSQSAPTFGVFDVGSNPPPTLHVAAVLRHQARRANVNVNAKMQLNKRVDQLEEKDVQSEGLQSEGVQSEGKNYGQMLGFSGRKAYCFATRERNSAGIASDAAQTLLKGVTKELTISSTSKSSGILTGPFTVLITHIIAQSTHGNLQEMSKCLYSTN